MGTMMLYQSADGGANWTSKPLPGDGVVMAIAGHPVNEQIIYAGGSYYSQGAVFRTSDGGSSWTRLGTSVFSGFVSALAIDPVSPFRIYATASDGVFRSDDSGATWTRCLDVETAAVLVDPAVPSRVYAGGRGGVRKSEDFGRTWSEYNQGLLVESVTDLEFNARSGALAAATQGAGLFQIRPGASFVLVLSAAPGGTTSPAPGTYRHAPGTRVSVAATPDMNYGFLGWSGDASGTANPLTITVNRDLAVEAEFQRTIYEPLDFRGEKKVNRSLMFVEYINDLTWQSNPANDPSLNYHLYLVEGTAPRLLASLGASTFSYRQRGVDKTKAYAYRLAAADPVTGREGPAATVTVR